MITRTPLFHQTTCSSLTPFFHLKYKPHPSNYLIYPRSNLSTKPIKSSQTPIDLTPKISSLDSIKPFVTSEWENILKGWLCSAVSVYALSKIVPRVGEFSSVMSRGVIGLRQEGLKIGGLFFILVVASYGQQAFLWDAALNCVYKIRVHVFDRVLERDLVFFESGNGVSSGDIAYRITAEASEVADTVYAILNTIVPSTLQLSAMATQMLVNSPLLSLISVLVIPSMTLVITYLGEKLQKISKEGNISIAALAAYLNEVLPSILFVKANNGEPSESLKFQRLACADLSERLKKKKMKALIPQIVQIIYFGVLFILCFGSLAVSGGSFDCSRLLAFMTSLVLLIRPIQDVGKAYNELKQGEPAIERLFDLSRFKSQMTEKPDAVDLDSVRGDITFYDVSFGYKEGMPLVLDGLSLHIKAGETVALVGPSGGGKTTFVKLLLRLYDTVSGCIHIDDININNMRLGSLRRHVGLVSQDVTLFTGTVAENIGYRDIMTEIDMKRVEAAARTANADEFIDRLPQRYATNVGPRGSTLSGGQRQRLAIARALYQNSSILILDEATSALDSRSELLVREAVQRLTEDHTVLIIAHRLETVLMAERVLLLDAGKLQEIPRSSLQVDEKISLTSAGLVI
ncbi:ABC transporter B family member 29, chloroplastic [Daucus carota subsp. sativus]|uniref:ABC transporter B family member 29, chloroplastic n=1 Tax=Daucus carota subsp. sativus TaxID=79200 RepID=UPI0007EFC497|nr:PREDICTED: ABC transporter B family member 29, chloroplastic [Daucus carota subsp. sativus]